MTLLISALTFGLIFAILALGVAVSFRIFQFADTTTDGSFTLGAAATATLLTGGFSPVLATLGGFAAGLLSGTATGILHTKFKINRLLSGILVMTALYSINLRIMGRSNLALNDLATLRTHAAEVARRLVGDREQVVLLGWPVGVADLAVLAAVLVLVVAVAVLLDLFLRTSLGSALVAAGDNPQMIRALGISDETLMILGLALGNALVALCGSLLAQYQGFADLQMGLGMIVWGLASVIIGESLVGPARFGLMIAGTVLGSVLFRLMIAIALRAGLNPNDLKLITALFVLAALVAPGWLRRRRPTRSAGRAPATPDA